MYSWCTLDRSHEKSREVTEIAFSLSHTLRPSLTSKQERVKMTSKFRQFLTKDAQQMTKRWLKMTWKWEDFIKMTLKCRRPMTFRDVLMTSLNVNDTSLRRYKRDVLNYLVIIINNDQLSAWSCLLGRCSPTKIRPTRFRTSLHISRFDKIHDRKTGPSHLPFGVSWDVADVDTFVIGSGST